MASLPRYGAATVRWTSFFYDGLDRLVRVQNADATFRTLSYDIDKRAAVGTEVPFAELRGAPSANAGRWTASSTRRRAATRRRAR